MSTPVTSILRAATRTTKDKLNALSFATHERYQQGLANTNANFYLFRTQGVKDWNFDYGELPKNHFLLDPNMGDAQIPQYIDFDLVLSQTEHMQCEIAQKISRIYHIPHISLKHTLPHPSWPQSRILQIKQQFRGDINVFISEYSRKQWGWEEDEAEVIHHGIDTDLFKPNEHIQKKKHILSVVNDWINRDAFCGFNLWKAVTENLPVRPVGATPGLSLPAKSIEELLLEYQQAQIFINTSLVSPVPTSLLEAMSVGSAVVSTATCMIPDIIENGYNGYCTNDPNQMRLYINKLLEDPEHCIELGKNARQTILENFSLDKFVNNWNNMFNKACQLIYKG